MFCSPWMDRIGVRSLKAAGSMATISICLAKQPVIHMSASVWQTMRLGQSQWQSVDWSFSIMFIQLFQCFQLQKRDSFVLIIFCSHLCECHESSDRVDLHKKKAEEWQSCKREETCNPKWLTDPETILGYPWYDAVTEAGWICSNTLRLSDPGLAVNKSPRMKSSTTFWSMTLGWSLTSRSSWIGRFFDDCGDWNHVESLRMWDKPYASKSLTGIRSWNMCCHPTKATIWIKLNPFATWKRDSMPRVQMM